jgi:hypothetical protein
MQSSVEELGQQITDELTDVFLHFVAADNAYRRLRLQLADDGRFDLDKPFLSWAPISSQ